jgi:hypothetical protein
MTRDDQISLRVISEQRVCDRCEAMAPLVPLSIHRLADGTYRVASFQTPTGWASLYFDGLDRTLDFCAACSKVLPTVLRIELGGAR